MTGYGELVAWSVLGALVIGLRLLDTRSGRRFLRARTERLADRWAAVFDGCFLACQYDALVTNRCRDVARISTKPKAAAASANRGQAQTPQPRLSSNKQSGERDLRDLVLSLLLRASGSHLVPLRFAGLRLAEGGLSARARLPTLLRISDIRPGVAGCLGQLSDSRPQSQQQARGKLYAVHPSRRPGRWHPVGRSTDVAGASGDAAIEFRARGQRRHW